jgi:hypothetical protein
MASIVWDNLVSSSNPNGTITYSDLELAGGLIQFNCAMQNLDTQDHTILSKRENLNTTFWERNGSTTTDAAPVYPAYVWYSSLFLPICLAGPSNPIADSLSWDFHLPISEITSCLAHLFPQTACNQLWTPQSKLVSVILSTLCRRQSRKD